MRIEALTKAGFGAQLLDVDLVRLDENQREQLRSVFHRAGGLILMREQDLRPEDFITFASTFGTLENNEKYDPDFLVPGHPEILRIGNLREGDRYRALFIEADPPPLLWHSDDTFRVPQPLGSCLFCVSTPPVGGETWFAGMVAAYDALSEEMKTRIDPLTAQHSYHHLNEFLRRKNPHRPPLSQAMRERFPPVTRPLVAVHPVTGLRSLDVPKCHIESVDGLSADEGEALVCALLEHATSEPFAYAHAWREGDVVMWDNRSVMHAPSPFDSERYQRLLYRITVAATT